MPSIAICTHCYAEKLPQYATFLRYQLSSLILYPPETKVRIYVCYTQVDTLTNSVIRWFRDEYDFNQLPLHIVRQPKPSLARRSIGRNIVAAGCEEDIVWFTDVDHFFHQGCLDGLSETWKSLPGNVVMTYPAEAMIHKDHALGDQRVLEAEMADTKKKLLDIHLEDFVPKSYNRAIGPYQIVRGDFARRHGYLGSKPEWQRPREDGKVLADFHDDVAFRKYCKNHGKIQKISITGLYRLRHTHTSYQPPKA